MWSKEYYAELDNESLDFLRAYAAWPRWRRLIWRAVGR